MAHSSPLQLLLDNAPRDRVMEAMCFAAQDPRAARAFGEFETLENLWSGASLPPPPGFAAALAHPMGAQAQALAQESVEGLSDGVARFSQEHPGARAGESCAEAAGVCWRQLGAGVAAIESLGLDWRQADALASRAFCREAFNILAAGSGPSALSDRLGALMSLAGLGSEPRQQPRHPPASIVLELVAGNLGALVLEQRLRPHHGDSFFRSPQGSRGPIPALEWAAHALGWIEPALTSLDPADIGAPMASRLGALARFVLAPTARPGESATDGFSHYAQSLAAPRARAPWLGSRRPSSTTTGGAWTPSSPAAASMARPPARALPATAFDCVRLSLGSNLKH